MAERNGSMADERLIMDKPSASKNTNWRGTAADEEADLSNARFAMDDSNLRIREGGLGPACERYYGR
ncbi:hypothetical protein YK56LOC_31030 [Caballeronia sp. HLA56]